MDRMFSVRGRALLLGGAAALGALLAFGDTAGAAEAIRRPVVRPGGARMASRPLTIRRRARPVIAAAPGFIDGYGVPYRQHAWDDPRLYYWGPFRTGGDSFYGDQAGNPITRGNAGLGMIAGYGGARGGYGGPHFDAVGGFHNGPGPDAQIDADYGSGSLSRPDYGGVVTAYPSVRQRVAILNRGVISREDAAAAGIVDRAVGRSPVMNGRSRVAEFEAVKARFAAPMNREAPPEAAFANGGLGSMGLQIGNDEF